MWKKSTSCQGLGRGGGLVKRGGTYTEPALVEIFPTAPGEKRDRLYNGRKRISSERKYPRLAGDRNEGKSRGQKGTSVFCRAPDGKRLGER